MVRPITSPDRLFDRTWRPGHPFGPKLSRWRRICMAGLLFVLCVIIGGYWFLTDSNRVRDIAQNYLSTIIGGRVRISSATLSIFEGLRLNDVRVYVDDSRDEESLLFKAQAFLLRTDPRALLRGKFEATQIVAIDPFVRLTEDLATGRWNHQRLRRRANAPSISTQPDAHPPQLPAIVLRNAQVEYNQIENGRRHTRGTMALEGQFVPGLEPDVYLFKLQSRGASQGIGPSVDGKVIMTSGLVTASLMNFRFGADLETMLPAQVRKWWRDHNLAGRVDVPELTYQPGRPGSTQSQSFRAEIDLRGVQMVVQPSEWLSSDEIHREQWTNSALQAMRGAGLDGGGFVKQLEAAVRPSPISMHQVTGKFVFTEDAIEVQNVSGFIESNGLKIDGRINNYSTPSDATASMHISSLETDDILIPASPRYINSMPQVVKEIYDHLRPQGRCRFWVDLQRTAPGARPLIDGEVRVLDGQFIFDKFPYPIVGASGRLVLGRNRQTGAEQLEILDVRGHGPISGPNRDARVQISGLVSPFGAETGVRVTVIGEDVVSEPTLFHAFPKPTQQALRLFDAPGKGEFPKFRGGFKCEIERPPGLDQRWNVITAIRLDEAAGSMVAFPYPMSNVSGELLITDDHVKIAHTLMRKNGATLQIDGDVSWSSDDDEDDDRDRAVEQHALHLLPTDPSQRMQSPAQATTSQSDDDLPPLQTDLRVLAENVPIDDDLLNALPADQRAWLKKLGMAGRFDLQGRIKPATQPASDVTTGPATPTSRPSDVDFDFAITLHNASLWPIEGTFAASNVTGRMHLTPGRIVFESISGKRNEADLSARGSASWGGGQQQLAITADAKNLSLDAALYNLIPASARNAWDQVRPQGTLDATLTYSGSGESGGINPPAFQLVLTPRQLSATPLSVPYKLDSLAGVVNIFPDRVVLQDITAKHGQAAVKLSATGAFGSNTSGANWDFRISADNVAIDDDFGRAVPKALSDLLKSVQLKGTIGFTFDKLLVSTPKQASSSKPAADAPADVDFAVRLNAQDAAMNVGVPTSNLQGSAGFSGMTRAGKLTQLEGSLDFATLTLAGYPATDLRAKLLKPADQDLLRVSKLEAKIVGGEVAGQFDIALGEAGPSRYAAALVLRNADVTQLTGDATPDLRGRLSASLALEGGYNDPTSRRGRGDVSVSGQSMYRIPLLLGLLQITNLSLPITSPFNEAAARYSVDGNRVTFESIELRAKDMLMQGNGHLDFGDKQVRLTFVTDNTTWPKLPIIGELIQGARHELLQIHVKGTLEEPKVSAGAFTTFTTTVDEVMRGNDAPEKGGK